MKFLIRILGILLGTMLITRLDAQKTDCYVIKTFPVNDGTSFSISNKFGDINVITVNEDSISVCALITIDQNNKDIASRSRQFIDISLKQNGDSISAFTTYDKKFFSPAYREGRKSFSVDYIIKTPPYVNIYITNSFGNITIEELSGFLNVRLSQGIMTAKRLTRGNINPVNSIYVDHSNVKINYTNWLSMKAHNCPSISVEEAHAILLISDFSKISIDEVNSLVSESKYDSYSFEKIKNLIAESHYSVLEIEELTGQLQATAYYGSITVADLPKEFKTIDITSNHTPIIINTGEEVSFAADLISTNNLIDLQVENDNTLKKSSDSFSTIITGVAGNNKETGSIIRIRTNAGKLSIR